jgi:hypothetical protein
LEVLDVSKSNIGTSLPVRRLVAERLRGASDQTDAERDAA